MNTQQWLICGLLITVLTHDLTNAFPHTVFAKKLIDIQKPVVEAKLRAAHETKALLKAKAADAAGKGMAAAAFMKKKALAVAAAPVVVAKALKAKFLAKKLGLAAAPLLLKQLKKHKFEGKEHYPVPPPPPVNFVFPPQYAEVGPVEEVLVPAPEEFTYVEEGKAPVPVGFVENALESLGNAVPILHPITDRMSRPFAFIRSALSSAVPPPGALGPPGPVGPQPLYHFLPELPPHLLPQYTHVETNVPTGELGLVSLEHDVVHEEVPQPVQEVHLEHVEVPHETYGVPQDLPHNQSYDGQQFRPITSYGAPLEHQ